MKDLLMFAMFDCVILELSRDVSKLSRHQYIVELRYTIHLDWYAVWVFSYSSGQNKI